MAVDNDLYNRDAHLWWADEGYLSLLRTGLNPVRFRYFHEILTNTLSRDPRGQRVLDVGCGGGLLAEEFARLGCHVVGIDPSAPSIAVARAHTQANSLTIAYGVANGEYLPFPNAVFDVVVCCDVLEHVAEVDRVLAESARVLKPGGVYCYDTINRTLLSRLLFVTLAQDWLSVLPPRLHDWRKFLTPHELHTQMVRYGITPRETVGLRPTLWRLLRALGKVRRGEMSYAEWGRRAGFQVSRQTWGSYMGYGLKVLPAARQ